MKEHHNFKKTNKKKKQKRASLVEGLDGEVDVGAGGGQRVVLPGRVVNLGHHLGETSRVIGCKQCQSYDKVPKHRQQHWKKGRLKRF